MATDLRLPPINMVVVAGRLGRDPEIRHTPKGVCVVTLLLVVNKYVKNPEGPGWREDKFFFDVTAWKHQAEYAKEHCRKGTAVLVEGSLESRTWEHDGKQRRIVQITARRLVVLTITRREEAGGTDAAGTGYSRAPLDGDSVPY